MRTDLIKELLLSKSADLHNISDEMIANDVDEIVANYYPNHDDDRSITNRFSAHDMILSVLRNRIELEPEYDYLCARVLTDSIVNGYLPVLSYHDYLKHTYKTFHKNGLVTRAVSDMFENEAILNAIDYSRDDKFKYLGIKTLYDRYLIKHQDLIEHPQSLFMRVAIGLCRDVKSSSAVDEIIEYYNVMNQQFEHYLFGS